MIYFDTNAFDHLHKRIGVTDDDVKMLKDRIHDHSLSVRLSVINLEEVLSAVPKAPDVAFEELRLMTEIGGLTEIIEPHDLLIPKVIKAYVAGSPEPSPYLKLSGILRTGLERLLDPGEDRDTLIALAADVASQIATFRGGMKDATKEVREVAKRIPKSERPTFERYWADLSVPFAESFAEPTGELDACRHRGLEELLQVRSIRFLVGSTLSLIYAYTFEKREPQQGDSRDQLHAVAASAARVFVTDDPQFARLLKRVPVDNFAVQSLPDFIASLK